MSAKSKLTKVKVGNVIRYAFHISSLHGHGREQADNGNDDDEGRRVLESGRLNFNNELNDKNGNDDNAETGY